MKKYFIISLIFVHKLCGMDDWSLGESPFLQVSEYNNPFGYNDTSSVVSA